VAVKDLGLLLRACVTLRDQGVAFRCVSVGDGPRRAELESLRTDLRLEPLVEFVGAAEEREVLRWWQRAALAVLTSESEGMPVCLMEAAACGVPAVATAVGGVPELIEEGVTGLLTPAGDMDAFAGAVRTLLQDPLRRAAMGSAARRRVAESFSLTGQVDQLLALWGEVLR
jgi:glycosyltransferase involved in cell wall biosynthesis